MRISFSTVLPIPQRCHPLIPVRLLRRNNLARVERGLVHEVVVAVKLVGNDVTFRSPVPAFAMVFDQVVDFRHLRPETE